MGCGAARHSKFIILSRVGASGKPGAVQCDRATVMSGVSLRGHLCPCTRTGSLLAAPHPTRIRLGVPRLDAGSRGRAGALPGGTKWWFKRCRGGPQNTVVSAPFRACESPPAGVATLLNVGQAHTAGRRMKRFPAIKASLCSRMLTGSESSMEKPYSAASSVM